MNISMHPRNQRSAVTAQLLVDCTPHAALQRDPRQRAVAAVNLAQSSRAQNARDRSDALV
jgi:hypothetical protein